jgi:hypothetical protein
MLTINNNEIIFDMPSFNNNMVILRNHHFPKEPAKDNNIGRTYSQRAINDLNAIQVDDKQSPQGKIRIQVPYN